MVYEVSAASVEWNPTTERIRVLAEKMPNSQVTEFGNVVVKAKVDSRSTRSTFIVDDSTNATKQTITREQALIAYTRSNAPFLFQEANLGSLAPGKYADLLVLDRDYLKVPADQLKDIKPLATMVGGKFVYDTLGSAKKAK